MSTGTGGAGMTGAPDPAVDLRCAAQLRAAGADPVGTAGTYQGFLLAEWPRPWPHDIAEVAELAPVRHALAEHGDGGAIRLQGLVPEQAGRRRVVLHRRPAGPFARYARSELEVSAPPRLDVDGARPSTEPAEVGRRMADAASALLAAGAPGSAGGAVRRDVLVCTHGRRDRCCGSWGTELWQALSVLDLGEDVGVWRTSHTGGHRYAATMIVLPEGTAWGFVDAASAQRILHRSAPIREVLPLYRGCSGLPSPAVQALERAVLAEVGWSLLDTPRTGEEIGDGRVSLTVDPEGAPQQWEATVTPGRVLPVPECGAVPSPGGKTSTELIVGELARVA